MPNEIDRLLSTHTDMIQRTISCQRRRVGVEVSTMFQEFRGEIGIRIMSLGLRVQDVVGAPTQRDVVRLMRFELMRIWQRMDLAMDAKDRRSRMEPPCISLLPHVASSENPQADYQTLMSGICADAIFVATAIQTRAQQYLDDVGTSPTLGNIKSRIASFRQAFPSVPVDKKLLSESINACFSELPEEIASLRYRIGAVIVEPIVDFDLVTANKPLREIGLPKSVLTVLRSENIVTVGQVLARRRFDLRWIVNGLGDRRMAELEKGMAKLGYALGPLVGSPWQSVQDRCVAPAPAEMT